MKEASTEVDNDTNNLATQRQFYHYPSGLWWMD